MLGFGWLGRGWGRLLCRMSPGSLLGLGTMAISAALALESLAPALWVIAVGAAVFGLGFGTVDTALIEA